MVSSTEPTGPVSGEGKPVLPFGMTLAIGSLPHADPERALDLILNACPEAPCWPQLPALGFQENMMVQFSEGIPCLRIDREAKKISFTRPEADPEALTRFYEDVFEAEQTCDLSAFELSDSFARGFHLFTERLSRVRETPAPFVKGQITGPLTFGLSVLDQEGLPSLFDDTLSDVIRKAILMKARWQIEQLRPCGKTGILFVDEPILAAFGSAAFINLSRQQAVSTLREIFSQVQSSGFLVGSHCCANTDWSLMVEAGVDIINFDAYAYLDSIGLYADSITAFLKRGGYLAWGIVPSQEIEKRPSAEDLFDLTCRGIDRLAEKGLPEKELSKNLLLTTSCGLATLSEKDAEQALDELKHLHLLVRARLKG